MVCRSLEGSQVGCIDGKPIVEFIDKENNKHFILTKNITYLGHPHPSYKKRIQLPNYYKDIYIKLNNNINSFVHFIGVYKFDEVEIMVSFKPSNYINNKFNNSSAHVYSFDIQKAQEEGVFIKIDSFGNRIDLIKFEKFEDYINGDLKTSNEILIFEKFNKKFISNTPLNAIDCIKKMHVEGSPNWRQAEWAGFYLEHEFAKYLNEGNYNDEVVFSKDKSEILDKYIDIDLWFPTSRFYGDLKASDITKNETPGNDQITVDKVISQYGKLWYIIYEHETVRDRDFKDGNYIATKQRNNYISRIDSKPLKELSYKNKMKHSVIFNSMFILEINKYNICLLKDFHQGKQQNGDFRKVKYIISKKIMKEFVIYSYHQ